MVRKKHFIFLLLTGCFIYFSCQRDFGSGGGVRLNPEAAPFEKLSDYRFFDGVMADLKGTQGMEPYELVSPLFSDYAEKSRFIYLPPGTEATYDPDEVFDFPVGTAIVKSFYYDNEITQAEQTERRVIETRLLVRRESGWDALPYIWNETQTEAYLEIAGGQREISFLTADGHRHDISYVVPNKNQCKGCHEYKGELSPIGPKARNLHIHGQLERLEEVGYLSGRPDGAPGFVMADYRNHGADLHKRAMAYLEINCGHCHREEGPAKTSGLHLLSTVKESAALGIYKSPVAAGKGSGGHAFDIVPGQPDSSILLYRMVATDPGVRMPELGRQLVHEEGVELIREWIAEMNSN